MTDPKEPDSTVEVVYATEEDRLAYIRLYQDVGELRKRYPQFMINMDVRWRDPRMSVPLYGDGKWFSFAPAKP